MSEACKVPPTLGLTERLKTLVFGSNGADALRRAEQRMLEGIKTKVRGAFRCCWTVTHAQKKGSSP